MLLGVNYHYIGEENEYPYPGIYATSPAHLTSQLELLERHFSFMGERDLLKVIAGEAALPERACIVTFDDGMQNPYERALPILDKLGIPAVFFVNGLPYGEQKAISIHKIHWARAHMPPETFWQKVQDYFRDITGDILDLSQLSVSEEELRKHYYYDDPYVARLKFALNKGFISADIRERIVDRIFLELVQNEKDFVKEFYMSPEQLRQLYKRGMLGIHTYSHPALSSIDEGVIRKEFDLCVEALSSVIQEHPFRLSSVSYPYGNAEVIPASIPNIGESLGFQLGFTMERSFNKALSHPLLLSRLDTNDVIGGRAPYFSIKDDGSIAMLNPRMTMYRHEYFRE